MSNIQMDTNMMTREYLLKELSTILEENSEIQKIIIQISQKRFADKNITEDRFDRILEELKKDREENNKKWEESNKRLEEYNKKWEENNKRWDENNKKWEESSKRWEESNKRLEEYNKKWDENNKRWDENNKKWEENNKKLDEIIRKSDERFAAILQEIKDIRSRHESSIGALGARWGIASESSFRNALKGILEDRFNVRVENITEYDKEGFVFGRPDQIELDIIIRNSEIIICEIKSSMSRADMYTFHRKVQFYEKQHNCKATSMIVISPMVDKKAVEVAEKLGIIIYSYAEDVKF